MKNQNVFYNGIKENSSWPPKNIKAYPDPIIVPYLLNPPNLSFK